MSAGYKREVLFQLGGAEVVKITWPPGSQTPLHDHGAGQGVTAKGIVKILEGMCFEERRGPDGSMKKAYCGVADMIEVDDSTVHVVGNCSADTVAVTLHVYVTSGNDSGKGMAEYMTVFGG